MFTQKQLAVFEQTLSQIARNQETWRQAVANVEESLIGYRTFLAEVERRERQIFELYPPRAQQPDAFWSLTIINHRKK